MDWESLVNWFWCLIIAAVGGYYLFWVGPSVTLYSFEYGVSTDKVYITREPTDCDFWHAPVGNKDCHYEKIVAPLPATGSGKAKYESVWVSCVRKED